MSELPLPHFDSLEDALASLFGNNIRIRRTSRIAGGDINQAYELVLTDNTRIFMKCNAKENMSFFHAEAAGLSAIARTGAINTPHILCSGLDDDRNCSFLLLEFIISKKRISKYWETLGQQLADMHGTPTAEFVPDGTYGFSQDNYIGAGRQKNTPQDSWCTFFRDCRLKPQFENASGFFHSTDFKKIDWLLDHIADILIEPTHPSLLHGDLWSGNVIPGSDGTAWLIDPAAYIGHAEADLAMTELFGGFSPNFYAAYQEVSPLQPSYERRRDLYNLYHLLNHLNLFGRAYLPSVKRILDEYAG